VWSGTGESTATPSKKFSRLLRYVGGDYDDPATYAALREELGKAKRPLFYLAIPPSLFATVVGRLHDARCDQGARVVVENRSDATSPRPGS